jgi:hypothetical protein
VPKGKGNILFIFFLKGITDRREGKKTTTCHWQIFINLFKLPRPEEGNPLKGKLPRPEEGKPLKGKLPRPEEGNPLKGKLPRGNP